MTMASIEMPSFSAASPGSGAGALFRFEPRFAATGLLMAALIAPTLFAFAVEDRAIEGVNVWIKPLKFQVSLALYLFTLSLFARFVAPDMLRSRRYRIYASVVVGAIVLEMVWISAAAALGTKSHFNESTPFWTVAYGVAGLAAVVLASASLVVGVAIARGRSPELPPAMRAAIAQGLIATFVLTLIAAGYLSSGGGHFVGVAPADAETLPVMGWARNGGDLRVPHFFATHAMQVVPLFGLVSAALFGRQRTWPVSLFTVAFAAFTLWTMAQAISGLPFLPGLR